MRVPCEEEVKQELRDNEAIKKKKKSRVNESKRKLDNQEKMKIDEKAELQHVKKDEP